MLENSLNANGYAIFTFTNLENIYKIQEIIKSGFPCVPNEFHKQAIDDETRLILVKNARDKILENNLIKNLFLDNSEELIKILGPDIDIQTDIYLRVSRPNNENDFIDWHRDTFYGNSYWEMNFWFPIFPLNEGAGLAIIEGSHLTPSTNIHSIEDKNSFRNKVVKGSLANELGYTYAPKSDDTISQCKPSQIKLIIPQLGQGVIFFAYAAHRAVNNSINTRISCDLRIKSMNAPTNTRAGYYQPLRRGAITTCVEKMMAMNKETA